MCINACNVDVTFPGEFPPTFKSFKRVAKSMPFGCARSESRVAQGCPRDVSVPPMTMAGPVGKSCENNVSARIACERNGASNRTSSPIFL